jgi:alpha-beta hydrolase superfamily lysophospholipase
VLSKQAVRWLLLRGLIREQRHWLDFPERFAALVHGPDASPTRTVLLDLPGFGSENDGPVPPTVAGFVDHLRARLRRTVPEGEPCGIFAVSLGGMVALEWLARHPGDFVAGVVVNSSLADLSWPWERMRPHNWPRVALAPFLSARARERMLLGMTRHQGDLESAADRYAAIAAATPPRRANAAGQLRAAMRMRCPQRLAVPTLVVASRGDRLVSWRCSARLAERLGLPLRLHEGEGDQAAGHDLALDAPDWVCAQVTAWLGEVGGTGARADAPPAAPARLRMPRPA